MQERQDPLCTGKVFPLLSPNSRYRVHWSWSIHPTPEPVQVPHSLTCFFNILLVFLDWCSLKTSEENSACIFLTCTSLSADFIPDFNIPTTCGERYLTNYKFPHYLTFTTFLLRFLCYVPIFSSTGVHKTLAVFAMTTRFCRVESHICGSPVWNLLHSTLLVPELWGGLKIFGKSVHPCSSTLFSQISSAYVSLLS